MPKDELMKPAMTDASATDIPATDVPATDTSGATGSAPDAERVEGVPVWYLVLAGALVASGDLSQEFQDTYHWFVYVPTVLTFVHLALWFTVFKRRRRYWKAVLRSSKARVLAISLALLRVALGLGLAALYTGPHEHLYLGLTMLVVVPVGAYVDQLLILRTLHAGSPREAK